MLASSSFRRGVAEAVGQRGGLARRVVRQAQHDEVHLRHHVAPRGGIAAALGGQALQFDIGQRAQAVADAEARGAGFAVDEHAWLGGHGDPPAVGRVIRERCGKQVAVPA